MSDIHEKLAHVQEELEVPKSRRNDFGDFNYRSCEDIVEKAKPVLKENGLVLTMSDDMVNKGDRYYIRAMAKVTDIESGEEFATTAYAREAKNKKGMDPSQLSGATSSYARKYALDGLFALDDSRDPDAMKTEKGSKTNNKQKPPPEKDSDTPPADIDAIKKDIEAKKDEWASWDDPATKKQA
ncbi:MAG: ERF family protein, partial [Clostridiales bacterium]|nr:ERF family protein [Clostridiales bacterium]